MYNNPYNFYNPQVSVDNINNNIAELEKLKSRLQQQISQPTNLTQNFQLAPSRDVIRYANSLDEVQRDLVIGDTPYFSKDMSVVWIKNVKGDIKTYELNEIVPKDNKDLQIELLQAQLNELRREMKKNDANVTNDDTKQDTASTEWDDETNGTATQESKSTSLSRVSASKKR